MSLLLAQLHQAAPNVAIVSFGVDELCTSAAGLEFHKQVVSMRVENGEMYLWNCVVLTELGLVVQRTW